jgi:hypothetical protein
MDNIIQGNKFKALAKCNYAPPKGMGIMVKNDFAAGDYRYLVNTLDKRLLNDGDIVYTTTFFVDMLFKQDIDKKIILITHNCDLNVNFPPPENIIVWYTTNVNIEHERVRSIPIGLENDVWLMNKSIKMQNKLTRKKVFKKMVYMNHNIKTNPAKRQPPYDILRGRPWVTSELGSNGQGFDNYLDNIYNHPFVVCPEGNGIDTHRVWECLYMRTIPIQVRNINNRFYTDLPILFIDDWEELSERMLHDEYMAMAEKKWDLEKLDFNYWKNVIEHCNPIL